MADPDDILECSKCDGDVRGDAAVGLTNGSNVWRILCPDCARGIGVPPGYELIRDLTPD